MIKFFKALFALPETLANLEKRVQYLERANQKLELYIEGTTAVVKSLNKERKEHTEVHANIEDLLKQMILVQYKDISDFALQNPSIVPKEQPPIQWRVIESLVKSKYGSEGVKYLHQHMKESTSYINKALERTNFDKNNI